MLICRAQFAPACNARSNSLGFLINSSYILRDSPISLLIVSNSISLTSPQLIPLAYFVRIIATCSDINDDNIRTEEFSGY